MYFGIQLMAPHGGLFVLLIPGAINHVLMYLFAIVAGTVVSGVLYAIVKKQRLKKPNKQWRVSLNHTTLSSIPSPCW